MIHPEYTFAWINLTEKISKDPSLKDNDPFMEAWAEAAWDFIALAEGLNTGNQSSNFRGHGRRLSDLTDIVLEVLHNKEYRDKFITSESNMRFFLTRMTELGKKISFELAHNVYRVMPDDVDLHRRVRSYRYYR